MDLQEKIEYLRQNSLFQSFSEAELVFLATHSEQLSLQPLETIIQEGEAANELFVILNGTIEIYKKAKTSEGNQHQLTILTANDFFGEAGLTRETDRSASARATEPTTLLKFPINIFKNNSVIFQKIMFNLVNTLNQRLRTTNDLTVQALQNKLAEERVRVSMSIFFTYCIMMISLYSLSVGIMAKFVQNSFQSTIFSTVMIALTAIAVYYVIKKSGHPKYLYGLTFFRWKYYLWEALAWSLPLMAGLTLLKWIFIHTVSTLRHEPLLSLEGFFELNARDDPLQQTYFIVLIVGIYMLFIPLQEFVIRGSVQTSLQEFLKIRHNTAWAIFISSVIFSTMHVHIDPTIIPFIFFCSIFWGILYAHQRTLVGVTASHVVLGFWGFFVLDAKHVTELLTTALFT